MSATTWEYKNVRLPGPPTNDDVALTALGAQGWQAISVLIWSNERLVLMMRDAAAWKNAK